MLFICITRRGERTCVDLNNAAVKQHLFSFPVLSASVKKPKLNTLNDFETSEPTVLNSMFYRMHISIL